MNRLKDKLLAISKKPYTYEGCNMAVDSSTPLVSTLQAIKLAKRYMRSVLSREQMRTIEYVPPEITNREDLVFDIREDRGIIQLFMNGVKHFEYNYNGFHKIQLTTELRTTGHQDFFIRCHRLNISGQDLINAKI